MTQDRHAELGTILGVFAHPDDEAYSAGGLMTEAVDAGRRVVCVTATRGEQGFPETDRRSLAERAALREGELAKCLATLGVTEHHWLDYRDGEGDRVDVAEAVAAVADLIADVRPDTVLTFGPDGMTGHVDHVAVSRWTTLAFRRAAPASARLLYMTQSREWNDRFMGSMDASRVMMVEGMTMPAVEPEDLAVWFRLDDELADRKVAALRCQASQVERLREELGADAYREMVREEFFRAAGDDDWRET